MNLTTRGPLYTCLVLLIAAIQYEELVGKCNNVDIDGRLIPSVDNKENCLKQCFLKEGAKGCNWFSNFEQCFAVMKTVGSSNNVENITCWRFITGKGKSQY